MPLPVFLFVLWSVWPLAAYPGGKLFALLIALMGLFALPGLNVRQLSGPVKTGLVLLAWVCLSAIWSPAGEGLFSGSLQGEDFALEASYLRFAFTLIGGFLFVRLVLKSDGDKLKSVPAWMCVGIGLHIILVAYMAVYRDALLLADGGFLVPTGQSMGRNANLLAMVMPLLVGSICMHWTPKKAALPGAALLVLTVALAMKLDGLAAILGLCLGGVAYLVLSFAPKAGFRALFNTVAAALLAAPFLAFGLGRLAPFLEGHIPLTAQQRLLIWQASFERILEKPVFGHGVNAAPTWTETYATRPEFLEQLRPDLVANKIIPNHPHNMALQIWAETGLVGAVLAAILLVMVGRKLPAPETFSNGVKIAATGLLGTALSYFAVSYSVWDESYWASIAIVLSGVIVLHRVRAV